jgi:hypothetical protein
MVEIGRVRVKTGNAPIEEKISAYPPQADICAFVSTLPRNQKGRHAALAGPKCKREGWLRTAYAPKAEALTAAVIDICGSMLPSLDMI